MKKLFPAVGALLVLLVLFIYLWRHPHAAPPPAAGGNSAPVNSQASSPKPVQNPASLTVNQPGSTTVNPASSSGNRSPAKAAAPSGSAPLQFTNFSPAIVLENMSRAIHQYGQMFGGNPVGTNPEITSQLSGKNPKHINFLNADAGMRVNGDGELVDPWGTPYFFHQLSGYDMEIHSAGPDGVMWTSDDLVSH